MSLILDGSVGVSDVDGSAATPAIRGTDANTGMFFPAADTIAFSEGGVESMRLNSSGVLVTTNDASISGLTVGKGGGAVATNTAIGSSALNANNTGGFTTAVGYQAGINNTSGQNTLIGANSGQYITTGTRNTGVGLSTLGFNNGAVFITSNDNSAYGSGALTVLTSGAANTALGSGSLAANTTASYNTAVGYETLKANTTAQFNTAVGMQSLRDNTTGANNTAIGGYQALIVNTTGGNNTAVGTGSLASNTTASNNTAVGYQAGFSMTTANNSTYIGATAGYNTTGRANTFIGRNDNGFGAGYLVTTGNRNTIVGGYEGNQGGLDIRTASNYIVLSDGDGNPRVVVDNTGALLVTKTVRNIATAGFQTDTTGQTDVTVSASECMNINRNTNDGDLIRFRQDNAVEGSISVSGTTVSYNGGHLSRWSQWQNQAGKPEVYRGSVLESTNDMCEWNQANEQATKTIISTTAKSKAVAGVFDMYDIDDEDSPYDFYVAQSGDFVIRIAQGVVVENGDLLESAGDGTAKPQADDICRSSTIAKVTSNYVSTTYADGSYCVPCILMIG